MDEIEKLRYDLIQYIRMKFISRSEILSSVEDIVNQGFVVALEKKDDQKINFGYISAVCVRIAYKQLKSKDNEYAPLESVGDLVSDDDVVNEIINGEETEAILNSLAVLKEVERIIIRERYYADFSFKEISEAHGIKLNTVLSHHRRALEKLRPEIMRFREYPEKTEYHELFD